MTATVKWRKPTRRVRELWRDGRVVGIIDRGSVPGHWWWVSWSFNCPGVGCSPTLRDARNRLLRALGMEP